MQIALASYTVRCLVPRSSPHAIFTLFARVGKAWEHTLPRPESMGCVRVGLGGRHGIVSGNVS